MSFIFLLLTSQLVWAADRPLHSDGIECNARIEGTDGVAIAVASSGHSVERAFVEEKEGLRFSIGVFGSLSIKASEDTKKIAARYYPQYYVAEKGAEGQVTEAWQNFSCLSRSYSFAKGAEGAHVDVDCLFMPPFPTGAGWEKAIIVDGRTWLDAKSVKPIRFQQKEFSGTHVLECVPTDVIPEPGPQPGRI